MKRSLVILIIFLGVFELTYSQTGWFQQPCGSANNLNDVFFADLNTGWVIGDNGSILKTTNSGVNWTSQITGTTRKLNSVAFIDAFTGYVVGGFSPYETIVLKTTNGGSNWLRMNSFPSPPIEASSVFFINVNTGFVTGNISGVCKTTNSGAAWAYYFVPGYSNLFRSLHFVDSNTGWLIAMDMGSYNARILKTTNGGINWFITYQGTGTNQLKTLHFYDINTGYAVGEGGVIIKTTNGGEDWLTVYNGAQYNFNSIDLINSNLAWVIGGTYTYNNRTILLTTNSGLDWIEQLNNQGNILNSVFFISSSIGWAVGNGGTILKTTSGGITFTGPISTEIPKSFSISQNYPNPFNPVTKIKFAVPKSGDVKLVIYDMLGREIAALVNEQLKPGTYEADWNASNYSSGVYFYMLKAGDFTQTKRMVLIK